MGAPFPLVTHGALPCVLCELSGRQPVSVLLEAEWAGAEHTAASFEGDERTTENTRNPTGLSEVALQMRCFR